MKILIIDNHIDEPWKLCADFRRYIDAEATVRRAPQDDLPRSLVGFTHLIISGSKTSVFDSSPWVKVLMDLIGRAINAGLPTLGVCYGHQLIARVCGGTQMVRRSLTPELGWVKISQTASHPLLNRLPKEFLSFQSHLEEVCSLPSGFVATASSEHCRIQAYYAEGKPLYGIQFHPEKNFEEGQASIQARKKQVPSDAFNDCLFQEKEASCSFSENIARIIFGSFIGKTPK